MEETIGYEERFSLGLEDVASYRDFFSAEEFDALASGAWVGLRDEWDPMDFGDYGPQPNAGGAGMADLIRYAVTLTVWVDATSDDEAHLILERHLAGGFDSEVIEVRSL